ncbi:MAG: glycosyltransferase family 4 protein [Candidatus Micrarchaeota archaeon]|nr:glycosyltransferase family 4 protein [Candidatus Micrarchaeota archaeon]
MKVLYFVHTFGEQNGISVHLLNLVSNLPPSVKYKVISGSGQGVPFFSSLRLPTPTQILNALSYDFDIIHVHGYGNFYSFFGALISFLKGKPLIWTIHGYPQISGARKLLYYFYKHFLAPFIFWRAKKIISVSHSALPFVKNETSKEVAVIPNGVDCELFKPSFGYKKAKYICFVGRLDKDKQAEKLLACDQYPLLFIGANEGKTKENLVLKAKLLGKKVEFGTFSYYDMPKAYQKCRYVVLPSKYEGFPLVLLEAIACGRPFLCTDVGENKRILSFLFKNPQHFIFSKNPKEAIDKLESIDLTQQLKKARKKLSFFSWKEISRQTVEAYKQALS